MTPPPCKCTCHKNYSEQMACMTGCDHDGDQRRDKAKFDRLLNVAKTAVQTLRTFYNPKMSPTYDWLVKAVDEFDPGWSERAGV